MKSLTTYIVFFSILLSCSSEEKEEIIEHEVLFKDSLFGDGREEIDEQNLIINDEVTWTALIEQMNFGDVIEGLPDIFPVIEVDFSQNQVIAAFDRVRSTGAYSIDIKILSQEEERLVKTIRTTPNGSAPLEITQPFIIVQIPKEERPIVID